MLTIAKDPNHLMPVVPAVATNNSIERKAEVKASVPDPEPIEAIPQHVLDAFSYINIPSQYSIHYIFSKIIAKIKQPTPVFEEFEEAALPRKIHVTVFPKNEAGDANVYAYQLPEGETYGLKQVQLAVQMIFRQRRFITACIVERVTIAALDSLKKLQTELDIYFKMHPESPYNQIIDVIQYDETQRDFVFYQKHFMGDFAYFCNLTAAVGNDFFISLMPGIFKSLIEQVDEFHRQGWVLNFGLNNIKFEGVGPFFNVVIEPCPSVSVSFYNPHPPEAKEMDPGAFARSLSGDIWTLGSIFQRFLKVKFPILDEEGKSINLEESKEGEKPRATPERMMVALDQIIQSMMQPDVTKRITAKELRERFCPILEAYDVDMRQGISKDISDKINKCELMGGNKRVPGPPFLNAVIRSVQQRGMAPFDFQQQVLLGNQCDIFRWRIGITRFYFDFSTTKAKGSTKDCSFQLGMEFPPCGKVSTFLAASLQVRNSPHFSSVKSAHKKENETLRNLLRTAQRHYFCSVFDEVHNDHLSISKHELCVGNLYYFMTNNLFNGVGLKKTRQRQLLYTQSILEQLTALNQVGIVHSDIVPSNLLVSADQTHLKLADFGLMNTHLTSPSITSPERFHTVHVRGKEHISKPADDIWAAGICIFFLLNNRLPKWCWLLDLHSALKDLQKKHMSNNNETKASVGVDQLPKLLEKLVNYDANFIANFDVDNRKENEFLDSLYTCLNILRSGKLPASMLPNSVDYIDIVQRLEGLITRTFIELEKMMHVPLDKTGFDDAKALMFDIARAMLYPNSKERFGIRELNQMYRERLDTLIKAYGE